MFKKIESKKKKITINSQQSEYDRYNKVKKVRSIKMKYKLLYSLEALIVDSLNFRIKEKKGKK